MIFMVLDPFGILITFDKNIKTKKELKYFKSFEKNVLKYKRV